MSRMGAAVSSSDLDGLLGIGAFGSDFANVVLLTDRRTGRRPLRSQLQFLQILPELGAELLILEAELHGGLQEAELVARVVPRPSISYA